MDVVSADTLSKAFKEGRQFLTAEVAFALEQLPVSPGCIRGLHHCDPLSQQARAR